jgi:Flp pilus assembly protein TadD
LKRFVLLLLCAALGACATLPTPVAAPPEPYFHDELFVAPAERIDAVDVFALSDAMKHYLQVDIARQLRTEGLSRGLINALYRRDQLKLDYDSATTRNAAQAFDARKGNCLSLVIMTAAFAKALGLQVTYQAVAIEETWSRSEGIAFLNTHVNLTLGPRGIHEKPGYDENRLLTIDFLPAELILGYRTRQVSEDTIVAMYMNNRAAEALARGQIDSAYWWARAAITRAPELTSPYNTLGVVYLRRGDAQAADRVLSHVLQRDPRNLQALSNQATALDALGRTDESSALRVQLARLEPYPPYHFFRLGVAAMQRADYQTAKSLFEKEVARAGYSGEFHYWLGLANFSLGDVDGARKQLAIALENSTTHKEHALYAAKLDRLRSDGVR